MLFSTANQHGEADIMSPENQEGGQFTEKQALDTVVTHGHALRVRRYKEWLIGVISEWDVKHLLDPNHKPYKRDVFMKKISESREINPIARDKAIALWHLYRIRDTRALRAVIGL